jgi:hypothetical protein
MRGRMTPHVVLYGQRRPESVLAAMENFISWEALRLAWNAPGETDSYLWQDLEQEAMLFVHRLLLRDPDIWMRKLERLTSLAMRSVLLRGRSVFRADPGPRQRQYRQVALTQVRSADICTRSLPLAQERAVLERALMQARNACNQQAEHQALLLLRRLARRYQDVELVLHCNQQLRNWWRRQRRHSAEGEQL